MDEAQFPDAILAKAFRILFGKDWMKGWPMKELALEMRGIIKGGTKPCIAFGNWVKCVNFLQAEEKKLRVKDNDTRATISQSVENALDNPNGLNGWKRDDESPYGMHSGTMFLKKKGTIVGIEFPHSYGAEESDYSILISKSHKKYTFTSKAKITAITITANKPASIVVKEIGVALSKIKT